SWRVRVLPLPGCHGRLAEGRHGRPCDLRHPGERQEQGRDRLLPQLGPHGRQGASDRARAHRLHARWPGRARPAGRSRGLRDQRDARCGRRGGRRRRRDRLPRQRHRGHPHLDPGSGPAAPHHGSHDPRGLRCARPAGVRDGARAVTKLDQVVVGAQGSGPAAGGGRRTSRRGGQRRGPWAAWIFVLPALAVYGFFTLQSLAKSVQYSFYSWNGIGEATWVGLANYVEVFSDPRRVTALANAFKLIFFYSFLSIALGLIAATLIRGLNSRWSRASQTL